MSIEDLFGSKDKDKKDKKDKKEKNEDGYPDENNDSGEVASSETENKNTVNENTADNTGDNFSQKNENDAGDETANATGNSESESSENTTGSNITETIGEASSLNNPEDSSNAPATENEKVLGQVYNLSESEREKLLQVNEDKFSEIETELTSLMETLGKTAEDGFGGSEYMYFVDPDSKAVLYFSYSNCVFTDGTNYLTGKWDWKNSDFITFTDAYGGTNKYEEVFDDEEICVNLASKTYRLKRCNRQDYDDMLLYIVDLQ